MRHRCAQRLAALTDASEWPEALRLHLDRCPACRVFAQRDLAVRRLVALKRYERPAPGFAGRLTDALQAPSAVGPEPVLFRPVLRYALAAAAIVLVGLTIYRVDFDPAPAAPPPAAFMPGPLEEQHAAVPPPVSTAALHRAVTLPALPPPHDPWGRPRVQMVDFEP